MVLLEIEIQSKLNIQGININAYILKSQNLHAPKFSRWLLFVLLYKICNILNTSKFWCEKSHSAHSFPKYMCMSKCEHIDIRKKKTTGKGKLNPYYRKHSLFTLWHTDRFFPHCYERDAGFHNPPQILYHGGRFWPRVHSFLFMDQTSLCAIAQKKERTQKKSI